MKFEIALATLLLLAGFATLGTLAGADEGPDDETSDGDHGKNQGKNESHEQQREEPGQPRKAGHFESANGSFDGRYVDFVLDRSACTVRDYAVYNVVFFSSVELGAPCRSETGKEHGGQIEIEGSQGELKIHDAPNGLLRLEAGRESGDDEEESSSSDGTLTFRVAEGVSVNATRQGYDLTVGNLTARLFATDDEPLVRDNATGAITAHDQKGTFLVHPAKEPSQQDREVHEAANKGHVGAQVDVIVENGTVTFEPLVFDDVIIKASKKNDTAFRFLVDANLTEGRVFIVNLPLGVFRAHDVGVRFFDADAGDPIALEVAIHKADSLADVLLIEPGEGPEFWAYHDEQGHHVLVAVPHFSVHVFDVLALSQTVEPVILFGAVAGVAFVAAAAVVMFVGRGRNKR